MRTKANTPLALLATVVLLILTLSQILCPTTVLAATFKITVIQSPNGTITPSAANPNPGDSKTFSITPNIGYSTASLIIDGLPVTVASEYTFTNIQADHNITANFAIQNFALTVTQNSNGYISPETTIVNYGANQTFSITPNTGYLIASLTVDGISIQPNSSYTLANVTANHSITATYAILAFNITVQQQSKGVISPETISVNYGSNQTFTITPNSGYSIASLIVDGLQLIGESSYTFSNVRASHSISATFTLASTSAPTPPPTSTTTPTSTNSPAPSTNMPTATPISVAPSNSTPISTSTPTPTKAAVFGSINLGSLSWLLLLLAIPFGTFAFGIVAIKRRKKKQDPKNPNVQLSTDSKQKEPDESIDQLFSKTEESVDQLFNKILVEEEQKIENENIPDYEKEEKKKRKYVKFARARQLMNE